MKRNKGIQLLRIVGALPLLLCLLIVYPLFVWVNFLLNGEFISPKDWMMDLR